MKKPISKLKQLGKYAVRNRMLAKYAISDKVLANDKAALWVQKTEKHSQDLFWDMQGLVQYLKESGNMKEANVVKKHMKTVKEVAKFLADLVEQESEGIILGHTEVIALALTKKDKKVVLAFLDKEPLSAKWLHTDGKMIEKMGMGTQVYAKWDGSKIKFVGETQVKSDEMIIRYLKKTVPKGLWKNPDDVIASFIKASSADEDLIINNIKIALKKLRIKDIKKITLDKTAGLVRYSPAHPEDGIQFSKFASGLTVDDIVGLLKHSIKSWKSSPAYRQKTASFIKADQTGDAVQKVAEILRSSKSKLMDMRKDLETIFPKKSIDFVLSPIAHYRIKVGGKTLIIVNKKYADDAEEIVGEYAIGFEGKI